MMEQQPWVSFCISTFKRPELLRNQLQLLLQQTFPHFHIVVSDNDPAASAQPVVESLGDPRVRYFSNGDNLGMIKSFNKSIERATTEYIVMVTDDDPIEKDFLSAFHQYCNQNPRYSIYCGFIRNNKNDKQKEIIEKDRFIIEVLDPDKTQRILWSSAIMKRDDALKIGCIPDYGSPHLADHAFLAMVGSINGGVMINRMYSSLTSHNTNFSKSNFESYLSGCKGFYRVITEFAIESVNRSAIEHTVKKHLGTWFITSVFNLKRYYTAQRKDPVILNEINLFAQKILDLHFMKKFALRYYRKQFIFNIKKIFGLLK